MRRVVFFPLPPLSALPGVVALTLGFAAIVSFICGTSFFDGGIVRLNPPLLVAIMDDAIGVVSPPPFAVLLLFVGVSAGF